MRTKVQVLHEVCFPDENKLICLQYGEWKNGSGELGSGFRIVKKNGKRIYPYSWRQTKIDSLDIIEQLIVEYRSKYEGK